MTNFKLLQARLARSVFEFLEKVFEKYPDITATVSLVSTESRADRCGIACVISHDPRSQDFEDLIINFHCWTNVSHMGAETADFDIDHGPDASVVHLGPLALPDDPDRPDYHTHLEHFTNDAIEEIQRSSSRLLELISTPIATTREEFETN